jgi:hypothetical protein
MVCTAAAPLTPASHLLSCSLPKHARNTGWLGAHSAPSKPMVGVFAEPLSKHLQPCCASARQGWHARPAVGQSQRCQVDAEAALCRSLVLLHCAHRHFYLCSRLQGTNERNSGHAGPAVRQIDRGIKWALEQRAAGRPVLVHCAHGHGRSLVLMCAILIVSGQVTLAAVGWFPSATLA